MAINTFPAPGGTIGQPYEQIFTTSGTWTRPNGVRTVEVIAAGGGATAHFTLGGSAGGAGAVFRGFFDVSSTPTVPVTIGAAGSTASVAASSGGTTSFGSHIVCGGGVGPSSSSNGGASGQWYLPSVGGSTLVYSTTSTGNTTGVDPNDVNTEGNGAIKWNGSYYLMLTSNGSTIKRSTDGITWTVIASVSVGTPANRLVLEWGNGLWVLVSWNSSNYFTSPDGVTWTTRTLPGSQTSARAISFANNIWFLAGSSASTLYSSTNAINWTTLTTNNTFSTTLGPVTFGNGVYVCPSTSGSFGWGIRSTDGVNWSGVSIGTGGNMNSNIVFNGSTFVSYSYSNTTVAWSTNGSTWNTLSAGNNGITNIVAFGGGSMFLTSWGSSALLSSIDGGRTWTTIQNVAWMYPFAGPNNSVTVFGQINTSPINIFRGGSYYGSTATPGGNANPSVGGSAGGGHMSFSNVLYPGPRVEGYGLGGHNLVPALAPGDGAFTNQTPQPGIVRVRWWA